MPFDPRDPKQLEALKSTVASWEKCRPLLSADNSILSMAAAVPALLAEVERLQVQLSLAQVENKRLATALQVPVTCPTCRTRFVREPLAEDAAALGRNSKGE